LQSRNKISPVSQIAGQYGIEISLDDQIFEDPYQKKFRLSMA